MDYDELRVHIQQLRKLELPAAGKYLICIVPQTIDDLSQLNDEADAFWVRGHRRLTITILKSVYLHQSTNARGLQSVELWMRTVLADTDYVADLDAYGNQLIVLRAANPSISTITRQCTYPESTAEHRASEDPKFDRQRSFTSITQTEPLMSTPTLSSELDRILMAQSKAHDNHSPINDEAAALIHHKLLKAEIKKEERQDTEPYHNNTMKPQDQSVDETRSHAALEPIDFYTASAEEQLHDEQLILQFDTRYMEAVREQGLEPDYLEALEQIGLLQLQTIEAGFTKHGSNDEAALWQKPCVELRAQVERQRTVIGVVGNTGAGKSSVINALLGEERLLPTNCMRACTAVVTELAWNEDDDPTRRYRAEIEFVSRLDWLKELDNLFEEVMDGGGFKGAINDPDSEAGIAYAKIQAVYPGIPHKDLNKTMMDQLLDHEAVKNVLGTIKHITARSSDPLYRSLQKYIDSKDREDEKAERPSGKTDEPRKTQCWPLIKRVKIFVKSEALSTGAVLVDLPGVQDSNAGRGAVADRYMKECSALWIVAPIIRAVDDKTAKNLLGDHFKRQLRFDGMISNVTFICSKTDDISVSDASESLRLESKLEPIDQEIAETEEQIKRHKSRLQGAEDAAKDFKNQFAAADKLWKIWMGLKADHNKGKTVYASAETVSRKRKAKVRKVANAKRCVRDDPSNEDASNGIHVTAEDGNADETSSEDDDVRIVQPLTAEEINDKVKELGQKKDEFRQQVEKADNCNEESKRHLEQCQEALLALEQKQVAICILARNERSRGRIQMDYAAGIRELDIQCGVEDDEDSFDPSQDFRDYDEVARSLPVFCVSSRAYQKLTGRMVRDGNANGFRSLEQTEIPQLLEHCKMMTVKSRIASSKIFIEKFVNLMISLNVWSSTDRSGERFSARFLEAEGKFLDRCLGQLEAALEKAAETTMAQVQNALAQIVARFAIATQIAEDKALPTSDTWGNQNHPGGFHWQTYRALMRRNGVFTNANGSHDLNKQLNEPFERHIVAEWERCFETTIPLIFQNFNRSTERTLRTFHQTVSDRAHKSKVGLVGIGLLEQKLRAWVGVHEGHASTLIRSISEKQKDANREFVPTITIAMTEGYKKCSCQSGPGSVKRMKDHMHNHVSVEGRIMFKAITAMLDERFSEMQSSIHGDLADQRHKMLEEIRRDYKNAAAAAQSYDKEMSYSERVMRADILNLVQMANSNMLRLSGSDWKEIMEKEFKCSAEVRPLPTCELKIVDEVPIAEDADVEMGDLMNEPPAVTVAEVEVEAGESIAIADAAASHPEG